MIRQRNTSLAKNNGSIPASSELIPTKSNLEEEEQDEIELGQLTDHLMVEESRRRHSHRVSLAVEEGHEVIAPHQSIDTNGLSLALQLGQAAYQYGASEYKVEDLLVHFLDPYFPECAICADISNTHLTVSIFDFGGQPKPPCNHGYALPLTVMVPVKGGIDLYKLGSLSDACDDLTSEPATKTFQKQFTALTNEQPLYPTKVHAVAYAILTAGYTTFVQGSRTDVALGFLGGCLAFGALQMFSKHAPQHQSTYGLMTVALLPAVLATAMNELFRVNVVAVVVASVILEVPGLRIMKATCLFSRNKLLAGMGHWMGALLVCFWLALGAVLGTHLVLCICNKQLEDIYLTEEELRPIDWKWHFLIAPMVGLCSSIHFGVAHSDLPGCVVVCCLAIAMGQIAPAYLPSPELGTVVAALITTLAVRLWGQVWLQRLVNRNQFAKPRPTLISLLPAFSALVGGSIGFRGFAYLVVGEEQNGWTVLYQFLMVPCLLVFGIYVGETLIPSSSTL